MLILIAESKTMTPVSMLKTDIQNNHMPEFKEEATKIASKLKETDLNQLASQLKISTGLTSKASTLFYDFDYPGNLGKAIELFKGEVFKAFDYHSLTPELQNKAIDSVRIISSLYGILKFTDDIKPYRLEYNCNFGPDDENLIKFWKPKVTVSLVKQIKQRDDKMVVNLLPSDAAKYIDWKIVKAYADVVKPDFKILKEGGSVKTPIASKLKECRGKFLHNLIEKEPYSTNPVDFNSDEFLYSSEMSKPGWPVYIV